MVLPAGARIVLLCLGSQSSVQSVSNNSVEGDDPYALCRELDEESDMTEKALPVEMAMGTLNSNT